MSKNLKLAPSYIVGLRDEDDPVAFWFDRAVLTFGRLVEQDIEKHTEKMKNAKSIERAATSRLMKWLDHDGTMGNQRFASPPPAAQVKKMPESLREAR